MNNKIDLQIENLKLKASLYFINYSGIILILCIVCLAAYGFELFNFNLTIDEETTGLMTRPKTVFITSGRWGLFLLHSLLFPKPVIPFIPLATGLVFHILSILIIIEAFSLKRFYERLIVGSIAITYPVMAFSYSFSILSYGIGFGLFCVSLSILLFMKLQGKFRYLAIFPGAFAISIYQTFIVALLSIYLLNIMVCLLSTKSNVKEKAISSGIVVFLSAITYFFISQLTIVIASLSNSQYIEHYFDIASLLTNLGWIIQKLSRLMFYIYTGDLSIYGLEIRAIALFMLIAGVGIFRYLVKADVKILNKFVFLGLFSIFITLPFLGGFATRGYIPMRSFVYLPFTFSGVAILSFNHRPKLYTLFLCVFSFLCVFQFVQSVNHLFGSSHLALQEDRVLGTQLIEQIELEKSLVVDKEINYFEMVGYIKRDSSPLISRIENIGASFFGWDQGNASRVLLFLQTLGYDGLEPLPLEERPGLVEIAENMPLWPESGSVKVVDDTVLVKFGAYSNQQIKTICSSEENLNFLSDFCQPK